MDDRELLELAAKAAGMIPREFQGNPHYMDGVLDCWNPLHDDGDALRLAVVLKMEIDHEHPADQDRWVMACTYGMSSHAVEEFGDESQRAAATRRAIVRAAAEIGRAMP